MRWLTDFTVFAATFVTFFVIFVVGREARASEGRRISGVVVTKKQEVVGGVTVVARSTADEQRTVTDADGRFRLSVPSGVVTLRVEGKHVAAVERAIQANEPSENLEIEIEFVLPRVHEHVVITAAPLDPAINRRNDQLYKSTLFDRDDHLLFTLDAGINAGQHQGGGKSLEIRRFGFNTDHGGLNGGLKILVDNVQQNQGTQGHGQGYLGQLKSLTPELIEDVDVLNGPFHAEYGDFSGLGVVHIRLKESLPQMLTLRLQGGSFDSGRAFLAYSPTVNEGDAFLAYEGSYTNGAFLNPLRYRRDNLTGNYTRRLGERQTLGFKVNAGWNDFFASGQVPLDEVAAGRLSRFGSIDPSEGGRVRTGIFGAYYRRDGPAGDVLKFDGSVSRSLFDLYSNFTFFLNDPVNGDGITQHDSRLQEGLNAQYLRPYRWLGQRMLLAAGSNYLDVQANVGLLSQVRRRPTGVTTSAGARVTNAAGYVTQGVDLWRNRLHLDGGVRVDYFRYKVNDAMEPQFSGVQGVMRAQPKANLAFTPALRLPVTFHFNYGRGIASQDARGVVRRPESRRISNTDFHQVGVAWNQRRISVSGDLFLIDRSNEQVYVPDDGSIELAGPSRAYGGEVKTSVQLTRRLAFNAGITRVGNAYYRGTSPRVYVDSAPHTVANAALTLADWRGFSGSLRYRHVSSYRLDGEDASARAAGLDVIELSVTKRLRRWMDFSVSVDNLTDKRYFETQNFFESRVCPADPAIHRIHGTPGFPIGVTVGLTFRLFEKAN